MASDGSGVARSVCVRGVDPGTQHSWYADVVVDEEGARVVRWGEWNAFLQPVDAVGVEFPSPRLIPERLNTHILLALCRIAATIVLHEADRNKVFLIDFDEWVGSRPVAKTRAAIDSVFLKLFSNAKKKGQRYYVDGHVVNEHIRDAAVLAFYTASRKLGRV